MELSEICLFITWIVAMLFAIIFLVLGLYEAYKKKSTLPEIIKQLESCNFTCEAGSLKNNTAFIALKEMAK